MREHISLQYAHIIPYRCTHFIASAYHTYFFYWSLFPCSCSSSSVSIAVSNIQLRDDLSAHLPEVFALREQEQSQQFLKIHLFLFQKQKLVFPFPF